MGQRYEKVERFKLRVEFFFKKVPASFLGDRDFLVDIHASLFGERDRVDCLLDHNLATVDNVQTASRVLNLATAQVINICVLEELTVVADAIDTRCCRVL